MKIDKSVVKPIVKKRVFSIVTFLFILCIFYSSHYFLGLHGKPRRIPDYADGPVQKHTIRYQEYSYEIEIGEQPPSFRVLSKDGIVLDSYKNFLQTTLTKPTINQISEGGVYTIDDECYTNLWVLHAPTKKNCIYEPQTIESLAFNSTAIEINGKLGTNGKYKFTLQINPKHPQQLSFNVKTNVNRIRVNFGLLQNEKIYGFGEQGTHVNLRDKIFPIMSSEQGVGRGQQPFSDLMNEKAGFVASGTEFTTYSPMPLFVTSLNRFLVLDNKEYQVWDLTEGISFDVTTERPNLELNGSFGKSLTPLDAVEQITVHTGRFKMLPDWIYQGAVIGYTGGTDVIRKLVKTLLSRDVPISGVWMQDWSGLRVDSFGSRLWWNWELDEDHYHSWTDLMDEFKEQKIKAMTYINPYLSNSVHLKNNSRQNLFKEAEGKGFLVKNSTGNPYILQSASAAFTYGTIDFSNPAAVEFYKNVIRCNMLKVCSCGSSDGNCEPQVFGFMADFGESLPMDAKLHIQDESVSEHNNFPIKWQELLSQVLGEFEQVVSFTRSGWTQTPGLTKLHWIGDQTVTWDEHDGLASALRSTLSCGFSGISLLHSDVGGYTSVAQLGVVRNLELFLRWAEYSAFADTVFRTHIGTNPSQVQVDTTEEASRGFAKAATWHKNLFVYRKSLMKIAVDKGWPLTRHMIMEFPNEDVGGFNNQFMMGHCLLVAPVLLPGKIKVEVYLPKGKWSYLWDDAVTNSKGEWKVVDAKIGRPAVFRRSDIVHDSFRSFKCSLIPEMISGEYVLE
jgi:alpha-glucosidase